MMSKVKAIETHLNLKEHVNGDGLLCITLYPGDFVSIGASTFIGYRTVHGDQLKLAIVSPRDQIVQRYEFIPKTAKLVYGDDQGD
jgi:hypothetical protein